MFDLTSLAYQPKSRERSAHPKRHKTFALSEQKSAYPAHTRESDEDGDDNPLVRPDRTAVSEREGDQPLVQPASRKEPVEEKRDSAAECRTPAQLRRRKGPPVWRDPSATLEQDVSGNSRECSEEVSILGRNPDGEALRNIINKLSDERNLRDLHLKTPPNVCCTVQEEDKSTRDFPGKVYDLHLPACGEDLPILHFDEAET